MKRSSRFGAVALSALMGASSIVATQAGASPDQPGEQFRVRIENISGSLPYTQAGAFAVPVGASGPAPALPGDAYSFRAHANPGDRLSFATMVVQSNDWVIAPGVAGIALHNSDGTPVSGDITSQLRVIDAGTEIDQTPGSGADQAPRQSGPNTGADDPNDTVRLAAGAPNAADLVRVTATPGDNGLFVITVENVSADSALPTPLAPGAYVVHGDSEPLFALGQADRGEGLEALAEDGDPSVLVGSLNPRTAIGSPLAPGAYVALRDGDAPIFTVGQADRGEGLEAVAEDGGAGGLAASLESRAGDSGLFNTPLGSDGPGPALPGSGYEFVVTAEAGDRLDFATMLVQSNDWFFAPRPGGIELFDANGDPIEGDVTDQVYVYDAGTERNEFPGFGPNQAPRQIGPDTGVDENGVVTLLGRGTGRFIQVTITPEG